jgi:hypothetical protein
MIFLFSGMLLAGELPLVTMQVNNKTVEQCEQLELMVQVFSTTDIKIGKPTSKGMSFFLQTIDTIPSKSGIEQIYRYTVEASPGSYIVRPPNNERLHSPSLYIDIGVDGPKSEIGGIIEIPANRGSPLFWLVFVFVGLLLILIFRQSTRADPEEVENLLSGKVPLAYSSATNVEKAIKVSQHFRRFLQQQLYGEFPSLTLNESKELLLNDHSLSESQRRTIVNILEEVDRVKYSGCTFSPQQWIQIETAIGHVISTVEAE